MVTSPDTYTALAALLMKGLGGDQASYASFLARITPLLRRMVARRLGASEVEDVVQEVLISIHKARHTYDGKRPLMPWLVAIARFRISDHLRRHYAQMRHQTVDIDDFTDRLADVTETDDSNESIEDLLHDVPDKQKRILTLMHVEGYTAKEVGAKLNMNESAVKVAAHRAIKKIRERFGS